MRKGLFTVAMVAAIAAGVTTTARAQAPAQAKAPAKPYVPPKTPWGDPDLQGNYTNKYEQGTPFERPAGIRRQDASRTFRARSWPTSIQRRQQQPIERDRSFPAIRPARSRADGVPRHLRGHARQPRPGS